jgi:transposase InsO family protein
MVATLASAWWAAAGFEDTLLRCESKPEVGHGNEIATAVNEVWSMDFVSDSLANGRRLKCLTVADDFSHECVDIAVDYGISGEYVTRLLDAAVNRPGF